MKIFRIIGRSIRDSFNSIFRNLAFSFASMFCITITLFMVSVSALLAQNVSEMTSKVKSDVTIVAFLDVDITEERIAEIEEILYGLDNLQNSKDAIVFNSKMNIREDWMESSGTYASIMRDWDTREENPLQDTFHIKVDNIEQIGKTAKEIEDIEGIEVVKYGEEMVGKLVNVFNIVKEGSFIIVIALIIVAAFLISNTIRITIFSRKTEIDIMRLVGASNINIKIPFFFEGLFIGIFGSLLPVTGTMYGYTKLYEVLDGGKIFGTTLLTLVEPTPLVYYVSALLVSIGAIVGIIGSVGAVKKYLKI